MKLCAIPCCGKALLARGFCSAHYNQWRKHGDPEYRQIAKRGEPLAWLYEHSTHDASECLIWPFKAKTIKGYGQVRFAGKLTGAHRVMCKLVHGPAPTLIHEAAHSCGNGRKACVNPIHLRWASPTENAADKNRHGTSSVGTNNAQAKLSINDVVEIRKRVALGDAHQKVADAFGVSRRNISMIAQHKTWRHVT